MKLAINDIRIGVRRREELWDLEALARSIERHGLLHPPVVDEEHTLVAGLRRLRAVQLLGRTEIEVRVFDDLTEAERREIELEENIRRKDLTPYERSKDLVQLAASMATRLQDPGQTSADFSSKIDEKSPRGRPPRADADAKLAAALGVAQSTLTLAKQHAEAVERYPELQNLTQHAALTIGKELDHLPEDAREERRAALREEAPDPRPPGGRRRRRRTSPAPARRHPRDPNRRWFQAAQALWRFHVLTDNHAAIVALARGWSHESLQRYREELQRAQARLIALEQAFEQLLAGAGAPPEGAREPDGDEADGAASQSQALCEPPVRPTPPAASVPACDTVTPDVPDGDAVAHHPGARHGNTTGGVAGALPDGAGDRPAPAWASGDMRATSRAIMEETTRETPDQAADPETAGALGGATPPVRQLDEGEPGLEDNAGDRRLALIHRITAVRAHGRSWRGIAKQFNADGVPTLSGRGVWDDSTLARFARTMGTASAGEAPVSCASGGTVRPCRKAAPQDPGVT
jgi:hypothetical protein